MNDNITFLQNVDPEVHPVMADGVQLQRVFWNLRNKGQDAMPDGRESIISVRNVIKQVQIDFMDSGEGISDEHIG